MYSTAGNWVIKVCFKYFAVPPLVLLIDILCIYCIEVPGSLNQWTPNALVFAAHHNALWVAIMENPAGQI